MGYKLVGIDLDGTLLNNNLQVTEYTRDTLLTCVKKGIRIVLASGRAYESMRNYTRDLDFIDEYVSLNGAVITCQKEGKKVYKAFFPKSEYKTILNKVKDINIPLYVYDTDRYYTQKHWYNLEQVNENSRMNAAIIEDFSMIEEPTKLLFCYNSQEDVDFLINTINHPDYVFMKTGYNYLELVRKEINKGDALRRIAERYGIKREETVAIGDSENDIEMISYAGLGIAMKTAAPNIKSIADVIADTNDNDGVAKAISKYILST